MKCNIFKFDNNIIFKVVICISLVYILYIFLDYVYTISIHKPIIENMINVESDNVDIISRYPLRWLKEKVKKWDISDEIYSNPEENNANLNITNNESYKRSMSLAILRKLPEIHREQMFKLSTYSDSDLKSFAEKLDITINDNGKTKKQKQIDLMDAISVQINPENTIKRWEKSYKHLLISGEEEEEEEETIDHKHHKDAFILRACPRLKNKCITDTEMNDYKYNECLDQDSYEKCMSCFINKRGESNYVNRGTGFDCTYTEMATLCMKENPGSCKHSKYLQCPCRTNKTDRENSDKKIDSHHSLINDNINNSKTKVLDAVVIHNSKYIPESTLNISQDKMTNYYNNIFKKD